MADNNSNLLTIVIIIIIVLVVLWLLWAWGGSPGGCAEAKPDPVGRIQTQSLGSGQVKITWDPTPRASYYRVYINVCEESNCQQPPNKPKPAQKPKNDRFKAKCSSCGGTDCCPGKCNACVSQTNYKQVVQVDTNEVVVETCDPCFCFIVVPYNRAGLAGGCQEVNYAQVQCTVDQIDAWIISSDCNGTKIGWNCARCCEKIHILVDHQTVECVPCSAQYVEIPLVPECLEIAIQCETPCGLGTPTVIVPESQPPQGTLKPRYDIRAARLAQQQGNVQQPMRQVNVPQQRPAPQATRPLTKQPVQRRPVVPQQKVNAPAAKQECIPCKRNQPNAQGKPAQSVAVQQRGVQAQQARAVPQQVKPRVAVPPRPAQQARAVPQAAKVAQTRQPIARRVAAPLM